MTGLEERIKRKALDLGFEVVGITNVGRMSGHDKALRDWCDAGFAAGMTYMTRRPELNANPQLLVPWAASVITLAVNYWAPAPSFDHESRYGRVARYAWGRDYHYVVKPRLLALAAEIEGLAARPLRARAFVDAVPLLERAVAAQAGLGFFGKNTNLLQPRRGSWFFLAELLVDMPLESQGEPIKVSCGSCRRCLEACPTGAFAGAYVLDSRRCISYLTIENKGAIPAEFRAGLGEWIFGCDVCQDVCPFNRFSSETTWPELGPEAGVGHRLDLVDLLSVASDREFRNRFGGTPLVRAKRKGLLRNAALVAANVNCTDAISALITRIEEEAEPLIRGHALWALSLLDRGTGKRLAERAIERDSDPFVVEEATGILENRRASAL